jgi:hypothetical protein
VSPDPPGPFESEAEVSKLPEVRAVYAAFDADPGAGKMAPHNLRMLLDALAGAGVYLGAYDHRIAEWLAGWEPTAVAVIAAWVTRASKVAARADELPGMSGDPPRPRLGRTGGRRREPQTLPRSQAPATAMVGQAADIGPAPREVTP